MPVSTPVRNIPPIIDASDVSASAGSLTARSVLTNPGHSALTLTGDPDAASSRNSPSLSATTPCLVTLYGAAPGSAVSPAIDAVLTMWPTTLLLHDRQERADAVDDAVQVDADHPLPQLDRIAPRVADAEDPGVVAQHVRGAETIDGELGELVDRGFRRGVADHGGDVGTGLAEAPFDVAQLRRVDVGEHDAHPLRNEALGEGQADAGGTSRDHCDVAGSDHGHQTNLERALPSNTVWPSATSGPRCNSAPS